MGAINKSHFSHTLFFHSETNGDDRFNTILRMLKIWQYVEKSALWIMNDSCFCVQFFFKNSIFFGESD